MSTYKKMLLLSLSAALFATSVITSNELPTEKTSKELSRWGKVKKGWNNNRSYCEAIVGITLAVVVTYIANEYYTACLNHHYRPFLCDENLSGANNIAYIKPHIKQSGRTFLNKFFSDDPEAIGIWYRILNGRVWDTLSREERDEVVLLFKRAIK